MCVYIYIYIHIYIHIYVHIHIHIHTCTDSLICLFKYLYVYIYIYTYIYLLHTAILLNSSIHVVAYSFTCIETQRPSKESLRAAPRGPAELASGAAPSLAARGPAASSPLGGSLGFKSWDATEEFQLNYRYPEPIFWTISPYHQHHFNLNSLTATQKGWAEWIQHSCRSSSCRLHLGNLHMLRTVWHMPLIVCISCNIFVDVLLSVNLYCTMI